MGDVAKWSLNLMSFNRAIIYTNLKRPYLNHPTIIYFNDYKTATINVGIFDSENDKYNEISVRTINTRLTTYD